MAWPVLLAEAETIIRYVNDIDMLYRISVDLAKLQAWVKEKIAKHEAKT